MTEMTDMTDTPEPIVVCPKCGHSPIGVACPACGEFPAERDRVGRLVGPMVALALILLLIAGVSSWLEGHVGYVLTLGIPGVVGLIVSAAVGGGFWRRLLLAIGIVVLGFGLFFSLDLMGLFCLVLSFPVFAIPVAAGVLLGMVFFPRDSWEDGRGRWLLGLAMLSVAALAAEARWRGGSPVVEVCTTRSFDASAAELWAALSYYDELTHEPPLLLQMGFPRPIRTTGVLEKPGDVQQCWYDKGHVTKLLETRELHRSVAFRVVEQRLGFERSGRLRGGSFRLEPVAAQTKVTVSTRYDARLRPRWVWGPLEEWTLHTFHDHLLEGLEIELSSLEMVKGR